MRAYSVVLALVAIMLFPQLVVGLYTPGKTFVDISITKENFASTVLDSDDVWLIEFYANWCGHCKNLAPIYEKVAENLNGMVKVAAIDVDAEKELAGLFGVQSMPTLKLIKPHTKVISAQGKMAPEPVAYNGARSAAALAQFALTGLEDYIEEVKAANLDKFLVQPKPKIMLFTNKPKASDLYRALASQYRSRAAFALVQQSDAAVVGKFGVTKFPTVLAVKDSDASAAVIYSGALKAVQLGEFIAQHALPAQAKQQQQQKATEEKPKVEERKPVLIQLTSDEVLKTNCLDKTGLCVIAFIDTQEESKTEYLAELQKAVEKQYKNFRFFWADESQSALRDALGVPEMLPGLAAFNPSKDRSIVFRSAFSADSIVDWLSTVLSGNVRKSLPVTTPLPSIKPAQKDEL